MTTPENKYSFKRLMLDSLGEFRSAKAAVMLLILTALAVVLGSNYCMRIPGDMRVSFSFICVMAAGVLFGPLPCMAVAGASDIAFFMLERDEESMEGYNAGILAVKLIVAFMYGIMLYKKYYGNFGWSKKLEDLFPECVVTNIDVAARGVISRIAAVFAGKVLLDSAVLYRTDYNDCFPFLTRLEWIDFVRWFEPGFDRCVRMLPFELAMVFLLMPVINVMYTLMGNGAANKGALADNKNLT